MKLTILPAGTLDQLRRDASAERPTHAWLFTGAAGAPRRRAALIFGDGVWRNVDGHGRLPIADAAPVRAV